jgi:hypothetical protein
MIDISQLKNAIKDIKMDIANNVMLAIQNTSVNIHKSQYIVGNKELQLALEFGIAKRKTPNSITFTPSGIPIGKDQKTLELLDTQYDTLNVIYEQEVVNVANKLYDNIRKQFNKRPRNP